MKHCRILSVLLHCGSELQGFRGSEWGYLYNTKNLIFFGSVTWSSLHFGKLSKFSIKYFQKKKTKNRLKKASINTEYMRKLSNFTGGQKPCTRII